MAGDSVITSRVSRKSNSKPECIGFITSQDEFVGKGTEAVERVRRSRSRSGTRKVPAVLSLSDEGFYQDLEEYVKMSREAGGDDVWQQLQQKESDLLLAAELGKALLEKNEELKKEQEKACEEYSRKLEVCH
ncbi:unnamed protein product [Leptidea sinapis]|uniref:HAP1 N-terminal domain-containing protein n=1 Tax=Leptidea sinapis TaxID=189913 RepID=A0A5E4QFL3_9NEOP|nr:unnamed protein product [Leptidea sinapis]